MTQLESITRGAIVRGILPEGIYRDREAMLEIVESGRPWNFDGDSRLFRLVSEAYRIRLAYLFDPLLAVHTSLVEPLPHQITAVYGELLERRPLRFLLADDPGAGKTIMTGLFIKELVARGDLQRCLIVCPGNLVEQWQEELDLKFHLPFEILTNDGLEAARTGNWFSEHPLAICRLDKLSRDEDAQAKLQQSDWDLIVCDESHKLSATYFGNEVKYTKRYRLGEGEILRRHCFLERVEHDLSRPHEKRRRGCGTRRTNPRGSGCPCRVRLLSGRATTVGRFWPNARSEADEVCRQGGGFTG